MAIELVKSFKIIDIERVESLGLNRKLMTKRTADAFLRQIVATGYFHCDLRDTFIAGIMNCQKVGRNV